MGTVPAPNFAQFDAAGGAQNAFAEYQRAAALKQQTALEQQQTQTANLENQKQQLALQDQQAMTKAMHDWDGQDLATLPDLMRKNGISAGGYMNAQQAVVDRKTKLAQLDKDQLSNMSAHHDAALGVLDAAEQVPDEQLAQHMSESAQQLQAQGHLTPQEAQAVIQHSQSMPPDQFRPWVDVYKKSLLGEKAAAEQAIKDREAGAKETTAAAEKQKADQGNWEVVAPLGVRVNKTTGETTPIAGAAMSPQMMEGKYVALQQKKNSGQPLSSDDAAFVKSYEHLKTLVPVANFNLQNSGLGTPAQPSAMAQAVANGQMKWQDVISPRTPQSVKENFAREVKTINPNFNSGDFTIEQAVKKDFTSGAAAKNLTAFKTAIEHANQAQVAADALDNGDLRALNTIGNKLGYEFGSDKTTNFNVIKNALSGEISKVFKGGEATDAEIKAVQAPFDAANSPAQLKGAIRQAIALMNSKRDALRQQYEAGSKAQPNFGGQPSATQPSGKVLSMSAIQQAAKDHGVSVDEAKRQAQAAGYTIQ